VRTHGQRALNARTSRSYCAAVGWMRRRPGRWERANVMSGSTSAVRAPCSHASSSALRRASRVNGVQLREARPALLRLGDAGEDEDGRQDEGEREQQTQSGGHEGPYRRATVTA
jgi:hypothetical protein